MNDKQWLDRVNLAYSIYSIDHKDTESVDQFIAWLYKQYGIVRSNNHTTVQKLYPDASTD